MAVTDYIFQEETVEKRNFGAWLVAKMVAAGWQQVGSNPPTAVTDLSSKFYVLKTKRDSDNAEVYIAINDAYLRTVASTYSSTLGLDLWTDYTPGTAGSSGSTTRGVGRIAPAVTQAPTTFYLFGNSGPFPLDTLITIRFCITKTNVTLFSRPPSTTNLLGQMLFFGLPEFLQKEKTTGGAMLFGTGSFNANSDQPLACDTPPGTSSSAGMYEMSGRWIDPQKSPDASGQFPLMPIFTSMAETGLRHKIPSFFLLRDGGILDRDIIQVNGMNFEIMTSQNAFGADLSSMRTMAYRIS